MHSYNRKYVIYFMNYYFFCQVLLIFTNCLRHGELIIFFHFCLSKFPFSTTSTLSVGSTGSQARLIQSSHAPAMYQPILMKDLGKIKTNENVSKIIGDSGDCVDGGDDEDKITEQVMDRHLNELVTNNIDKTNTIYDIAKYMANLKEKHMESKLKLELNSIQQQMQQSGKSTSTETDVESGTDENNATQDESRLKHSEEEKKNSIIIDKRVDKIFKSEKSTSHTKQEQQESKRLLKSPRRSVQLLHSPERNNYVSPVKIIKVRSPRNSIDRGRRTSVSLSRESSSDRRNYEQQQNQQQRHVRRTSEGGILKTTYSTDSQSSCPGILKHGGHASKQKSIDRQSSLNYRKSLSPGTSFDSRSPDRYHLSPHTYDSRSPERPSSESCYAELDFQRRHLYRSDQVSSNQSSFDSRSPERDRKRSLSAHCNFTQPNQHDAQQYQCPPGDHYYYYNSRYSPELGGKRQSKSLERPTIKDGFHSNSRRGYSPERTGLPSRSQSAENALSRNRIYLTRSNDSLARSIEQPTCVECLYQRKPS